MDEALILTAVDISGRGMLCFGLDIPTQKVGTFDTELAKEFLIALEHHSTPLVEGISWAKRGSMAAAVPRERARLLNAPSMIWWLFSPDSWRT